MPLHYPIHTATLPNGLRVVVSPDHSVPAVSVNLWVGVGSRHEKPGHTGLAHLFEHLMFQGSRNVAEGEHFAAVMRHGGRANATTSADRTNYFETVPTGALELALWLEADRHQFLLDAVTQANLDNQRDVVVEEKRQRYDNSPFGHALHDVFATVFPEGHPYSHPTIGSMEDLQAASLEDVHAFFRAHYGPSACVLSLVGDVDAEAAVELVARHFGEWDNAVEPWAPTSARLGPLASPVRLERHEDVPNDRLYLAFLLPPEGEPDYDAAALGMDALGGLTSSRMYNRFVRGEELLTGISASTLGWVDGVSLGLVIADVSEGEDPARVEAALLAEMDHLADVGPSEVEVATALADTERSWLLELAAHGDRADLISQYTLLHDDPHYLNTWFERISQVTPEHVHAVADQWLRPQHAATVAYLRKDPS